MRDLLIGVGYFSTTLLWIAYGICLVLKPQRFSTLLSHPLFGPRSTERVEDWTQNDNRYWRKIGVITAAAGAFMFFMPLAIALMRSDDGSAATAVSELHHSTSGGLVSYAVWFLFLCLGIALVARPFHVVGYFRPREKSAILNSSDSFFGPRIVGGVVILVALVGLLQLARH